MTAARPSARRANLDDLPVLRGLWQSERLPGHELEKRLTEFHVALRPDGLLTGTAGFLASGPHALLHSVAFASPAQAADGLPVLWEHLLALARAQGVTRLWMRGEPEAHWQEAGFQPATAAQLRKLPPVLGPSGGSWWTLALRDEAVSAEAIEKEFAALHAAEQERTERLERQARLWKFLAWGIALLFFLGAGWVLLLLLRANRRSRREQ